MKMHSLVALLLVAGCHADTGPTDPMDSGTSVIPLGEFMAQQNDARCAFMARCGDIALSERSACISNLTLVQALSSSAYSLDEAIAAGRVRLDGEAERRCLDGLRALPCRSTTALAACLSYLVGLVPEGGACQSPFECAGGFCAGADGKLLADGCGGACVAYVPIGGTCDGVSKRCDGKEAYCDADTHTCVARGGAGASCQMTSQCTLELKCNGNQCGPFAVGEFCSGSGSCVEGSYCDDTLPQPVCVAVGTEGGDCHHRFGCADGLACIGLSSQVPGYCGPWRDVGAGCDPSKTVTGCPLDVPCEQTTNTCRSNVSAVGSPCTSFCTSIGVPDNFILFCNSKNQCVARVGVGDSCGNSTSACYPSYSCDVGTMTCQPQCG